MDKRLIWMKNFLERNRSLSEKKRNVGETSVTHLNENEMKEDFDKGDIEKVNPYVCSFCNNTYVKQDDLVRHEQLCRNFVSVDHLETTPTFGQRSVYLVANVASSSCSESSGLRNDPLSDNPYGVIDGDVDTESDNLLHAGQFERDFTNSQNMEMLPGDEWSENSSHLPKTSVNSEIFQRLENLSSSENVIHLDQVIKEEDCNETATSCNSSLNVEFNLTNSNILVDSNADAERVHPQVVGQFDNSKGVRLSDNVVVTFTRYLQKQQDKDMKRYTCEICGSKFGNRRSFTKHMFKHRDKCPFCFKSFLSSFAMREHKLICTKANWKTPTYLQKKQGTHCDDVKNVDENGGIQYGDASIMSLRNTKYLGDNTLPSSISCDHEVGVDRARLIDQNIVDVNLGVGKNGEMESLETSAYKLREKGLVSLRGNPSSTMVLGDVAENMDIVALNSSTCKGTLKDRSQNVFESVALEFSGGILGDDTEDPEHFDNTNGYDCSKCDEIFPRLAELLAHMEAFHEVKCNICHRSFQEAYALFRHEKQQTCCKMTAEKETRLSLHKDALSFNCLKCFQSFKDLRNLRSHMNVHNSHSFRCQHCGRKTGSAVKLKRHMKIHKKKYTRKQSVSRLQNVSGKVASIEDDECLQMQFPVTSFGKVENVERRIGYACYQCDKSFKGLWELISHMEVLHECKCYKCHRSFRNFYTLYKHESLQKCSRERVVEEDARLPSQKDVKHFKCLECFKSYQNRISLHRHMNVHRPDNPYRCQLCGHETDSAFTLKRHNMKHHKMKLLRKPGNSRLQSTGEGVDETVVEEDPDRFTCLKCYKSYQCPKSLHRHMNIHRPDNPFRCLICGHDTDSAFMFKKHMKCHNKRISRKPGISRLQSNGEVVDERVVEEDAKRFKCLICYKSYQWHKTLRIHMNIHRPDNPFRCLICGHNTDTVCMLKKHMKRHKKIISKKPGISRLQSSGEGVDETVVEEDAKRFKCIKCYKSYQSKKSLRRHMNVHRPDNPYRCLICGHNTDSACMLKKHLKCHNKRISRKPGISRLQSTGEVVDERVVEEDAKRFKCLKCFRSYQWKKSLRSHMNVVHRPDNPYRCLICGHDTDSACMLKKHMKRHDKNANWFKCLECFKSYQYRKNLLRHMKSHKMELSRKPENSKVLNTGEELDQTDLLDFPMADNGTNAAFDGSNEKGNLEVDLINFSVSVDSFTQNSETENMSLEKNCCSENIKQQIFIITCNICMRSFKNHASMYGHWRTHKSATPRTREQLTCKVCGKNFNSYVSLYGHKRIHKINKLSVKEKASHVQQQKKKKATLVASKCIRCDKGFPNDALLHKHRIKGKCYGQKVKIENYQLLGKGNSVAQKQSRVMGDFVQSTDKGRTLNRSQVEASHEQWTCSDCGKSFSSLKGLHGHSRVHVILKEIKKKNMWNCNDCSKSFSSLKGLHVHSRMHVVSKVR